jgi:glycosyltransferase involved in cell wall biosynthesis
MPRKMKVLVGITSNNWCAAHTTRGIAPYSKHDITVQRFKGGLITKFFQEDSFENYDIIYFHSSRLLPKGIIWKEQNPGSMKWGGGIRGWPAYKKYKAGWQNLDFLSTPSHGVKKIVMEHPKYPMQNVHVCHQGVDPEQFYPMPELRSDEFTISWAGNLGRASKRFKMFLELPYNKISAGPNTRNWGGSGLLDYRTELPQFYNRAHVYIQPARNDAFSACPVESAFSGVPAVGFRGFPERGGNGITEYLPQKWLRETKMIKGEGELPLLIEMIEELRENPDVLQAYSEELRSIVIQKYTHEIVAREYDEMFISTESY